MDNKVISLVIGLFILLFQSCTYCGSKEKFEIREVYSLINNKYEQVWNRGERIFEYRDKNNSIRKFSLLGDQSGLWDYLEIGDSLAKPKNNKLVKVYREGELKREFTLDFGCD